MNIRTGDKVQFVPVPAYELRPDYIATGIVTRLQNWGGCEYALVKRDDGLLPKLVDVRELTRLTDTALVKAVAAMGQDDQQREDAISALNNARSLRERMVARGIETDSVRALEEVREGRIADIVDDYEFSVGEAGNLGGCEIL